MTAPGRGRPPIVVIAGPTASGKTDLALTLARRFGGELVGADSVQVYRGFDLGSAKPTADELGDVSHHLLDVLDPGEAIDAMGYAALADRAIAAIAERGALPVVVGGTGLWLRALLRGLVDVPPVDPVLRARLEADAEREGNAALHARLRDVDPRSAETIHENDRLRIVRALEVFEQTGQPLGELRHAHRLGVARYQGVFVFVDRPQAELARRIDARIDRMLEAGWVAEAQRLLRQHGGEVRPFGSVGYRQLREHLEDGVPLEDTLAKIRKATRVYARRQRTWFRGEPGFGSAISPEAALEEEILATVADLVSRPHESPSTR